MQNNEKLPVGKLPADLLASILADAPVNDPDVLLGPGPGLDCAIVEFGTNLLVLKSDPITFASDQTGWYLVQVNANDIATTGAIPRWMLLTVLLPEDQSTPDNVRQIIRDVYAACLDLNVSVVGGHTEITQGVNRPVAIATMLGVVPREQLVLPTGASPGDRVLLTKGVPIEAISILSREFSDRMAEKFSVGEINDAQRYLLDPGISIVRDSQISRQAGKVSAMHDPTEGGIKTALWELADACQHTIVVELTRIPVLPLAAKICDYFSLDPLSSISSGALLLTASPGESNKITQALADSGISCSDIGHVEAGRPWVFSTENGRRVDLPRPARDEIARLFDSLA